MNVEDRKLLRFRFLKNLYDLTGGEETEYVKDSPIIEQLSQGGIPQHEIEKAIKYLENEGLVSYTTGRQVRFTHEGVVEIEAALSEPDEPTRHFPVNIIQIGQMENSLIQQGTEHSSQTAFLSKLATAHGSFSGELIEVTNALDEDWEVESGWTMILEPTSYRKRFDGYTPLEQCVRQLQSQVSHRHRFPDPHDLDRTEWGVKKSSLRFQFAMTHSGLFVCRTLLWEDKKRHESQWRNTDGTPTHAPIEAGNWIDAEGSLFSLLEHYTLIDRFQAAIDDDVSFLLSLSPLRGRKLVPATGEVERVMDVSRECAAAKFPREGVATKGSFDFRAECADAMTAYVQLFHADHDLDAAALQRFIKKYGAE